MADAAADPVAAPLSLAVVGAGPIGIEMALGAADRGMRVHLFERGEGPACTVESYKHVQLFSPWTINTTELGRQTLEMAGCPLEDLEQCPTGQEYLEKYLAPLTGSIGSRADCKVSFGTEVLSIGRGFLLKGESINGGQMKFPTGRPLVTKERNATPFRLLVRQGDDERFEEGFDLVADCSGAYFRQDMANWAGPGGLPALGERALRARGRIWSIIPDVFGADRVRFAGRRTAVVGGGYSAATSVRLLLQLAEEEPGTEVLWATRRAGDPYEVLDEDVLPLRKTLCVFGNQVARGDVNGVDYVSGCSLHSISKAEGGRLSLALDVAGSDASELRIEEADELVTCVGYHPDTSLFEELQVHQCYASDGPIKLAASLLGASGDCMQQAAPGVDMLKNPEPGFFILGSKSYGRNSAFLLKIGFEQVRVVLDSVRPESDP